MSANISAPDPKRTFTRRISGLDEDTETTLVTTSRIKIRHFMASDAKAFISFMIDADSTRFLEFEDNQKTAFGAAELLEATITSYNSQQPRMAFAVERRSTGEFVGFCGLTPRNEQDIEIMYAVAPGAAGQGLATEIAKALANHALKQLGYARVIAPIRTDHVASLAVASKAGFQLQGHEGDRDVYALSKSTD